MRPGEQEYHDRYHEDEMKELAFGIEPETRDCPACGGQGHYIRDDRGPRSDDWHSYSVDCTRCDGTGEVEA